RLSAEDAPLRPLRDKPNDPAANLALGRFACFSAGSWFKGVNFLANRSDAELAALAQRDAQAQAQANAATRAEVGEGWWQQADKEPAKLQQETIRQRARYWFRRVLTEPPGAEDDKKLAVQRLTTVVAGKEMKPGLVAEFFSDRNLNEKRKLKGVAQYKIF